MSDADASDEELELSAWEKDAVTSLQGAKLPLWEYKAQAATYAQGHRGILDLDLDFPEQYLKGPTVHCYVWKIEIADGTRVHAYADVDGKRYHLKWLEAPGQKAQTQPEHLEGPCPKEACSVCDAAQHIAKLCTQ